MNKTEFLEQLRKALRKLPSTEIEKSLTFYAEMIDDRVEEGESEEAAVASMGDPATIAATIIEELPAIPKVITKSKTKSHTLNWVLAIALSPFWVPLAFALLMVLFMVYLCIWMLVLCIWIVAVTFLIAAPITIITFIYSMMQGYWGLGIWELGTGFFVAGIGIFCLYGAIKTTAVLTQASKRYANKVSSLFRKEPVYAI